jgi:F-type H+-transporting ATPase subunit delta
MTLSAVAARYANALADVVTAPASAITPQNAAAELRAFEAALESSQELREVLATPAVPIGRKKAVIGRIAEALGLSRLPRNFLYVLVDHRRIGSLTAIIQQFEDVVDSHLGFVRADVASAGPLSDAQRAALGAQLERLTGKKVRMRVEVDSALIGGAVARIGSTVYDGSVRGQLAALERRLTAEN